MRLLLLSLLIGYSSLSLSKTDYSVKTYIPKKAYVYVYEIQWQKEIVFEDFPDSYLHYFPALIEYESCISLRWNSCWDPTSNFKTSREYGAGLGQLTKAYRKDGTIRFDTLSALAKKHSNYLKDLSWSNVLQRADLQIRAILLLSKDNYRWVKTYTEDPVVVLAFMDSAYNGGLGGLNKDRRYCGLEKGCDPTKWSDHVETHSLKSRKKLYGDRSAYDINRHHVNDVLNNRMGKYRFFYTFE